MAEAKTTIQDEVKKMAEQSAESFDRRIFFIGMGAVGKLIAHSFADIPEPPPMTLLFQSKYDYFQWIKRGEILEVLRNGISDAHEGFEGAVTPFSRRIISSEEESESLIYNLVVATKAMNAVAALRRVKHRLGPDSTIMLIQNGMGLVEELNEKVFPEIETRPQYVIGVVSHGVINKSIYQFEHTGIGSIALSALPRKQFENHDELRSPVTLLPQSTRYLARTVTRTPILGGIALSPQELLLVQLEKLACNCIINPLTAILEIPNGDLSKPGAMLLVRLLLAEISLVLRALPELESVPGIEERFGPISLERKFKNLIEKTAKNRSSSLQDINAGRETEIGYLNGYIFRRGEENGIRCMVNYTVMCMVRAKTLQTRLASHVAIETSDNDADLDVGG